MSKYEQLVTILNAICEKADEKYENEESNTYAQLMKDGERIMAKAIKRAIAAVEEGV